MRVVLLRHGETEGNLNHQFSGFTDTPLTEKGREQAKSAHPKLVGESFDVIYSSPLSRAFDTAVLATGHRPVKIDGLKEMNFGIFEGLTYQEIQEVYPKAFVKWQMESSDYDFETGESLKGFYSRIIETYERLIKEKNENILIVAHSGVIRSIIAHVIGSGLDDYWRYQIDNCGVSVIRYLEKYPILEALNR